MKTITTISIILLSINPASASLETDKTAGECAALLVALKKPAVAATALEMADNQKRASNLGLAWMKRMKSYGADNSLIQGMVYEASSECRKIGIRSSD